MQYAVCGMYLRHGESCTVNPTGKSIGTRREDGEHGSNTGDRGVKIAGSDQRIALRDKRVLEGKESLDQLGPKVTLGPCGSARRAKSTW